jgi:hypothetical protein
MRKPDNLVQMPKFREVGVLVDPVAGTDPVVAVGDDEWVLVVAAQQQDR